MSQSSWVSSDTELASRHLEKKVFTEAAALQPRELKRNIWRSVLAAATPISSRRLRFEQQLVTDLRAKIYKAQRAPLRKPVREKNLQKMQFDNLVGASQNPWRSCQKMEEEYAFKKPYPVQQIQRSEDRTASQNMDIDVVIQSPAADCSQSYGHEQGHYYNRLDPSLQNYGHENGHHDNLSLQKSELDYILEDLEDILSN